MHVSIQACFLPFPFVVYKWRTVQYSSVQDSSAWLRCFSHGQDERYTIARIARLARLAAFDRPIVYRERERELLIAIIAHGTIALTYS